MSFQGLDLVLRWISFSFRALGLMQTSSQAQSVSAAVFRTLEMFNRIQVRVLAGPLEDIHRTVSKPFLWVFCVFWVIVMLEAQRFWALWNGFSLKNTPHTIVLPPTCFTVGTVSGEWAGFLQISCSEPRPDIVVFIRTEHLVVLRVLKWPLGVLLKLPGLHTGVSDHHALGHLSKGPLLQFA